MQLAPACSALSINLLTIVSTTSVLDSERLPPQQSVLKDHGLTSTPTAASSLSRSVGFSTESQQQTSGGRTSVVRHGLQALEADPLPFLYLGKTDVVDRHVEQVPNLSLEPGVRTDRLFDLHGQLLVLENAGLRDLQARIAGGAYNEHVAALAICYRQVPARKRDAQHVVRHVPAGRAAAAPVGKLVKLYPQGLAYRLARQAVFLGGAGLRTARKE